MFGNGGELLFKPANGSGDEPCQQGNDQAQADLLDFGIVGDAEATLEDGILTLKVDLRPPSDN